VRDRRFRAVLLDLFDTLVKWDPSRLPEMEIGGRTIHSTIPYLVPPLEQALGREFRLATFIDAYREVLHEIEADRDRSGVEITCTERFRRTLARLETTVAGRADDLAEQLTRVHMAAVRSVTSAPPENVAVVLHLAACHRLGLLSNFDDARTGREILADTGVADRFEVVVISAEVAFRKPHPEIFRRALGELHLEPHEVLFVGDTPRDDVYGARNAGIPVAWVTNGKGPFPSDVPEPDFTIARLTDLPALLDR
jgi:HAD superfamily hydrolase (TIGR01509 family)